MNQIEVIVKSVYGKPLIYPACKKAQALADIAGTKTLSEQNLKQAGALGFSVVQIEVADSRVMRLNAQA